MTPEVYWTRIAENKVFAIMEHHRTIEGISTASQLLQDIIAKTLELEEDPTLGQKEAALADKPQDFRYLLYKNYKILYLINEAKNRIDVITVIETKEEFDEQAFGEVSDLR